MTGFTPSWVVTIEPFEDLKESDVEAGVSAILVSVRRLGVASLNPEIKSSNLLNNLLARREAVRAGATEGILMNPRGDLAEGAHSNLFWLGPDGVLRTPALGVGILPGITRDKVLVVARGMGMTVAEVEAPPMCLLDAREIMLTSTSWEVLSVTTYNGVTVGDGRQGEAARCLESWPAQPLRRSERNGLNRRGRIDGRVRETRDTEHKERGMEGNRPPVDLRSDTVTKPTPAMRRAIAEAEVGDDVFGDDPTVRELERRVARLLGKAGGLFVASGTMGNQVAVAVHTRPGDEVLLEERSHVFLYEAGAPAVISGVQVRTLPGEGGLITAETLRSSLRSHDVHFSDTRLLVFENTHNRAGGRVLSDRWDAGDGRSRARAGDQRPPGRRAPLERRDRLGRAGGPVRGVLRFRLGLLLQGARRPRRFGPLRE